MKNLTLTALLSRASRVAWGMFLALGTVASSYGQLTGYTAELDTMLWETEAGDPLEGLAYYGVYKVYANLTSPEDVVSAVYSDMVALGTPEMGIDAPCGCANAANTSVSVDASNNPAFFSAFPEYEYDSFWTIGVETSEDPGQLPSSIGMGMPTDLCSGMNIVNDTSLGCVTFKTGVSLASYGGATVSLHGTTTTAMYT